MLSSGPQGAINNLNKRKAATILEEHSVEEAYKRGQNHGLIEAVMVIEDFKSRGLIEVIISEIDRRASEILES